MQPWAPGRKTSVPPTPAPPPYGRGAAALSPAPDNLLRSPIHPPLHIQRAEIVCAFQEGLSPLASSSGAPGGRSSVRTCSLFRKRGPPSGSFPALLAQADLVSIISEKGPHPGGGGPGNCLSHRVHAGGPRPAGAVQRHLRSLFSTCPRHES